MVTEREIYTHIRKALSDSGIEDSDFEAGVIFDELFKSYFFSDFKKIDPDGSLLEEKKLLLEEWLGERTGGMPLQYILGEWEFYGLSFKVGKGVLIPRQDTETLVDTVLELMKGRRGLKIADLCSGTGCIPIVLSKKLDCESVSGVESSEEAICYLNDNIKAHNCDIKVYKADVLKKDARSDFCDLDLITCNPPYLDSKDMESLQKEVRAEPRAALFGGDDGLLFYKIIPSLWKDSLKSGGYLVFEIGCEQADDVCKLMRDAGYDDVTVVRDLCGKQRVVVGRKP